MSYIYNLTDTWNAAGTTFSGIKMAVTNTASGASSKLLDLSVSGATTGSFSVDKSGNASFSGALTLGTPLSPANGGSGITTLGPTFSAYQSTAQTALSAATYTKLAFQTKDFDTANCFDNVTNFRFTPNVAGYYQVNGGLYINGTTTLLLVAIYKNGNQWKFGNYINVSSASPVSTVASIVYLNGTTDYVELYGYTAASLSPVNSPMGTFFNAFMARPA